MLKAFWAAIQCGRHHGKGNKFKERGNLEKALMHFKLALPYAEETGNLGTVAFQMECIAVTYLEMKNPTAAKEYAENCLKLYRSLVEASRADIFAEAVLRVEQMLDQNQA